MAHRLLKKLAYSIAVGFGSGLMPWMPGTWGTLLAALIYVMGFSLLPTLYFVVLNSGLTVLAVIISEYVARDLGGGDPSEIVIDEMVAFWWTVLLLPAQPVWIIGGFIGFRFFDIVKPWPIGYLDRRFKGGLGIVLDDLVAALYCVVIIRLLLVTAAHLDVF